MIEEYFKLIALRQEHRKKERDLDDQISNLRHEIREAYYYPFDKDVVVKVNGQYYLVGDLGGEGVRSIDLIESHEGRLEVE